MRDAFTPNTVSDCRYGSTLDEHVRGEAAKAFALEDGVDVRRTHRVPPTMLNM